MVNNTFVQMMEALGYDIELTYSINSDAISTYAKYIREVLLAVYEFMDKMNFSPTNTTLDIKSNTIIVWEKNS